MQAKKDVEFMKEIEERVKKELRTSQIGSSVNIPNNQSNSYTLIQQSSSNSATASPAFRPSKFAPNEI